MKIKIITDSASNMDMDMLNKYSMDMVSLVYEEDGTNKPCYDSSKSYDEQGKEFYDKLRAGKRFKTSLPSIASFIDIFEKYLKDGYDIIYVSISSKLSGSLNAAMNAANILKDDYKDRTILCIDSMSASFGEAIVAIEASKYAEQGLSIKEIENKINKMRLTVRNEFTVDDLKFLKTGGRIKSIILSVADFLNIKPMLRASKEATIELCGQVRGRNKALRRLAETVKDTIKDPNNQTLYIAHCDCLDEAEKLKKLIIEEVPNIGNIEIKMYDFCTGAHVGPGAIAVFYFGESRAKVRKLFNRKESE